MNLAACESIRQLVKFFGSAKFSIVLVNLDGLTKHIAWLYILIMLEIRLLL